MTDPPVAADRLAETVALLRIAGRVAQLGGWTIQLPSRKLTWSDETCAIHDLPAGYKPTLDEGLGYYPPEHRADVVRLMDTCERDGTGYDFEVPKLTATGRSIWVRSIGEAVRDADGRIVGLQGAFQDVSTRRHAEQAAQEAALRSERIQRALAHELETEHARLIAAQAVANIGSWETELTTLATVWSAETHRIFEATPEHFHPTHAAFLQLVHPEDRSAVDDAFARSIEDCSSGAIEHRLLMPDGRIKFVEERWRIVGNEQREPARAIGTCQDITDRRRAQDAIRTQAHMLDQIGQAVITTDIEGRVTYANRFAGELYGWTPDEMLGQVIMELIVPQATRAQGQEIMTRLLRGETWTGEFLVQSRNGRVFPAHVTDSPVLDERGDLIGIIGISTDVSARKQAEDEARHKDALILRAQRMESIGLLAGGIAHDLNNVLAPILLSIGLLHRDEHDAERIATLVTIEASAKRGAAMVGRLLSFARGDDGQREEVEVAPLMRDLATIVRDTFPKNIALVHHLDPDLWALEADATQLHQLLLNLCVNARDAMPSGGRITLTADNIIIDEVFAAVNIDAHAGPYVTIGVEDTGTGIAKENIDKIFDPFFTTKEIGKGTGLGLATSLAIVTSHQGFLRVSSSAATGTRFDIYLPAQTTRAAPAEPLAAVVHPQSAGEMVLVVDDEEGIREIAKRMLEKYGYRVLLAGDGVEAIALYRQHQADIAVVLTDMMMPLMDGAATIKELVGLNPEVRIIAVSGLTTDARAAGVAAARVTQFLSKPYTAETLLTAVRAALPPTTLRPG